MVSVACLEFVCAYRALRTTTPNLSVSIHSSIAHSVHLIAHICSFKMYSWQKLWINKIIINELSINSSYHLCRDLHSIRMFFRKLRLLFMGPILFHEDYIWSNWKEGHLRLKWKDVFWSPSSLASSPKTLYTFYYQHYLQGQMGYYQSN